MIAFWKLNGGVRAVLLVCLAACAIGVCGAEVPSQETATQEAATEPGSTEAAVGPGPGNDAGAGRAAADDSDSEPGERSAPAAEEGDDAWAAGTAKGEQDEILGNWEDQLVPMDVSELTGRKVHRELRIDLSLQDAIRMALENSLDIHVSRLDDRQRSREIVVAQAIFDPFFNMGTTYGKNRDPSASFIDNPTRQGVSVSPSENTSYYGSITGKYALGTQYELRLQQSERDRPTLDPNFTFLNPLTETSAIASLRQPLLKDGWYSVNTADIRIAENNYRISKEELELTIIDVVFRTEQAYWELAFAAKNLEAKQKALSVTMDNLENVRKKQQIGTLAAIDVTTAESQLALRRAELEEAELLHENSRDVLLNTVNYTRDRSLKDLWEAGSRIAPYDNMEVHCTSSPSMAPPDLTRNKAIASAFARRPEYRRLELFVRNQQIRMDVAKNSLLPSLDVIGQWTQQGLEQTFVDSYSEMGTGKYYNWLIGVEFSIPLSNRGPRSQYRNARDELRKLKLDKLDAENQIVLEVDQALRRIESLRRKVRDLDNRVRLQMELVKAERIKLEVGKSIAYAVSVIENDLVEDAALALRAKADLQVARAELHRAAGNLLEWHKIDVVSGEQQ